MKTNTIDTIENTTGKRRRDNTWTLGDGLNMICLLNVLQPDSTSVPFPKRLPSFLPHLASQVSTFFFTIKLHVDRVQKI